MLEIQCVSGQILRILAHYNTPIHICSPLSEIRKFHFTSSWRRMLTLIFSPLCLCKLLNNLMSLLIWFKALRWVMLFMINGHMFGGHLILWHIKSTSCGRIYSNKPDFKWMWSSCSRGWQEFFFWLLLKDRLNIRNILRRKRRVLDDYSFALCNNTVEETSLHLFFTCSLANGAGGFYIFSGMLIWKLQRELFRVEETLTLLFSGR